MAIDVSAGGDGNAMRPHSQAYFTGPVDQSTNERVSFGCATPSELLRERLDLGAVQINQ
jgi:hypothetical protein